MEKEIEFKVLDENFEVIDDEEYYPEDPPVDEKEEKKFAEIKEYINQEVLAMKEGIEKKTSVENFELEERFFEEDKDKKEMKELAENMNLRLPDEFF